MTLALDERITPTDDVAAGSRPDNLTAIIRDYDQQHPARRSSVCDPHTYAAWIVRSCGLNQRAQAVFDRDEVPADRRSGVFAEAVVKYRVYLEVAAALAVVGGFSGGSRSGSAPLGLS